MRQNLEALDITQHKLDEQLDKLKKKVEFFGEKVLMLETDQYGAVKIIDDKHTAVLGISLNSIVENTGLNKDIFISKESSGDIKINNNTFGYVMKKMKDDSYFFLLMKI